MGGVDPVHCQIFSVQQQKLIPLTMERRHMIANEFDGEKRRQHTARKPLSFFLGCWLLAAAALIAGCWGLLLVECCCC